MQKNISLCEENYITIGCFLSHTHFIINVQFFTLDALKDGGKCIMATMKC